MNSQPHPEVTRKLEELEQADLPERSQELSRLIDELEVELDNSGKSSNEAGDGH